MTARAGARVDPAGERPRWLDPDQQRTWRLWLALSAQLPAALNRQLQQDSNLSLQDFEVLVALNDAPDGRRRAGAVALALQWERSRMSHHIKRMEARALVVREECEADRRGAFVAITGDGRAALDSAAPNHVSLVRQLMFDALPGEELDAVASYLDRALQRLRDRQIADGVPVPLADTDALRTDAADAVSAP